jgi:hypothetical protein
MKLWLWVTLSQLVSGPLNAASTNGFMPPPKMPNMDHLTPTLAAPPISKAILGKLVIAFELTTLDEVQKSAGIGAIKHMGDAGGSEDWLCYTVTLPRQSVSVQPPHLF